MVGWRRVAHGTPASVADVLTDVVHGTFISGMNAAFGVAALVALAGAVIALLARRGQPVEDAAVIY